MKQTAVDWLVNQLEKHYVFQDIKNTTAFFHAKIIEKEQIVDANIAGMEFIPVDPNKHQQDAEDYYNETFSTK